MSLRKYYWIHLFFWFGLTVFWFVFNKAGMPDNKACLEITLVDVAAIAASAYAINYGLMPRFFDRAKRKWVVFYFIVVVFVFGTMILFSNLFILQPYLNQRDRQEGLLWSNLISESYLSVLFISSVGAVIKLGYDWLQSQRRIERLEKENTKAELALLKDQMNPHFLLNSLNTIYYKIDKQNTEARNILIKFSDMLKYQLYDSVTEQVSIERELEYLKNYVNIQQVRLNENYKVDFSYDGNINGFSIASNLLIPFVENSFKHVSHFENKLNKIKIELVKQSDSIFFHVLNTKEEKENNSEQSGIGLVNVRRRLKLLYPEKHELLINELKNRYEVKLKIDVL